MKVVLLIIFTFLNTIGLQAAVSEKTYEKKFPKDEIEELVLSNEYGKVEVVQSESNEIEITAKIEVIAKSESKSDEILEVIDIKDAVTENYINVQTTFGKDMGLRQMLSGISVNVDYKVNIPKGIKLRLVNTNGNIFIADFVGEINVDLRNGDFMGGTINGGELYIKQDKGNFQITDVAMLNGDFKSCDIVIEEGKDVKLTTSSCNGNLKSIEKLNIRSSGGVMKLGQVEEMNGSSSFTKYEIQDIGNILDMNMKMGEINVRNIHFTFSEVHIKGSFTKVGLTFMEGAGYNLELKRNKSLKMDLPRGMVLEEHPTSERNMLVGTKFVGNVKYSGKVFLELSNGNLYIQ